MDNIKKIGLGTFPFSHVFGELSDKEAGKIVNKYIDFGGEYIQTAPYYKGVDPLMGSILKNIKRDKFYLATLCAKNREGIRTGKYEEILKQCEDSLKNIGIEHIDLYMTSTTKSDVPFSETIGAMKELKEQGKIRNIGVCNVTLEQLKEYNETNDVKFVQNRYSLVCQSLNSDFINYCADNDIGIIPYNVIEHGLLTSKILENFDLRDDDLRRSVKHFRDEAVEAMQNWAINDLKPLADSINGTIERLAIWWALQQPKITRVVVGATTTNQIQNNMEGAKILKYDSLLEKINKAYDNFSKIIKEKHSTSVSAFLGNIY